MSGIRAPATADRVPGSRLQTFAPELLVHIVGYLSPPTNDLYEGLSNTRDVLSVMQTCRAFAPPARTVLYRRPVIRPSALADRFVERVLDDPAAAVAVHDISQIGYALLATPRLEAAEEVTETVLRTCPNISTALVRPTSVNEANRLGALLDALPRLSSLEIRLFLTDDRRANPAILDACLAPIRTRVHRERDDTALVAPGPRSRTA